MQKIKSWALTASLLLTPCLAHSSVVDQVSPHTSASFNLDNNTLTWEQVVYVDISGQLLGISLYDVNTEENIGFFLEQGDIWQSQASAIYSASVHLAFAWNYIDLSSLNLYYNQGDSFIIGLTGESQGVWLGGSYQTPAAYPGILYLNGSPYAPDWRIGFQTTMSTAVPEPETVSMFALGLLGLGIASRKKA